MRLLPRSLLNRVFLLYGLTLSALLHVVVGAALLLRALAPTETKRFFRRAVQVLFMKSAPPLKKRMS